MMETSAPSPHPEATPLWVHALRAFALAVLGLSLAAGIGTFPAWWADATSGEAWCSLELEADHARVSAHHLPTSPCARLALRGARIFSIDGVALGASTAPATRDRILRGPHGSLHQWEIERPGGARERVTVPYELGPVAERLRNVGDTQVEVVTGTVLLLGSATATLSFLTAGFLYWRIGRQHPLMLVCAAGMFAAAGLAFDHPDAAPWYAVLRDAAYLIAVFGFAAALVTLPGTQIRSRVSVIYATVWVGASVLLLDPVLVPWEGPPAVWARVANLGFLLGAVAILARRYTRESTLPERAKLRWVLLSLVGVVFISVPLVVPILGPLASALHRHLLLPLAWVPLPLALVNATDDDVPWDLPRIVRNATVGAMGLQVGALSALVVATLHIPGVTGPVMILATAALVTLVTRRWWTHLTDLTFFPHLLDRERALWEARSALEDCWTPEDVAWCANRIVASAFSASGGRLIRVRGSGLEPFPPAHDPPEGLLRAARVALESGVPTPWMATAGDPLPTILIPLVRRDERIGVLVAPPPPHRAHTRREVSVLERLAPAFSEAMWRHTR